MDTENGVVARMLSEVCINGQCPRLSGDLSLWECEWARQAIEVLNEHSLEDLVQNGPHRIGFGMVEVVRHAMEVASVPNSLLYALGPHPALLQRIVRTVGILDQEQDRKALLEELRFLSKRLADEHAGTAFGLLWRTVGAALVREPVHSVFMPTDPVSIAEGYYFRCKAIGLSQADVLHEFLASIGVDLIEPSPAECPTTRTLGVVLVVLQRGSKGPVDVLYGAARMIVEVAKYVQKTGYLVVVAGCAECSLGTFEGLLYFGCEDEVDLVRRVRGFGKIDTVIGVSRVDVVACAKASRGIVYHHGPHSIQGTRSPSIVNRLNIPVVCPSKFSALQQVDFGIHDSNVSCVYNGLRKGVFVGSVDRHVRHRMIFAGTIVDYKGVDIAIRAFELLKKEFLDAEFHVYGKNSFDWHCWLLPDAHHLRECWIAEDGTIDFDAVASVLPGLRYFGSKPSGEIAHAFGRASVLVMPSRVGETFGLVSIEAQACGCIPVLPRHGAFPETMQGNRTGYLYDENTPEALAAIVGMLWRKGLPSNDQRAEAIRFVNEKFEPERVGVDVLHVIERQPRRSLLSRRLMFTYWCYEACQGYNGTLRGVGAAIVSLLRPHRFETVNNSECYVDSG